MTYDGVTYYYITNPMGDVTSIANSSGTQLLYYYYTAYGTAYVSYNTAYQALGATLSGVNPLFYRGYVYDRETGLYYLQSRYYNPKVGRFINADALVSTGQGLLGNNMFAYCGNNPVVFSDKAGYYKSLTCKQLEGGAAGLLSGIVILWPFLDDLAAGAVKVVEEIANLVVELVNSAKKVTDHHGVSVYVLIDPKDKLVKYVGISNDPDSRKKQHDRAYSRRQNYEMKVIATGLTREEARAFEQTLISAFTLDYLENARREIALRNIDGFISYFDAVSELLSGISVDELLRLVKEQ